MPTVDELRDGLSIDKYALDDELDNQPKLFDMVGEAAVEAGAKRDLLKEELATVDAELDNEARRKLAKDGARVTDTMAKTYIQAHARHQKAFKAYMDAKLEADKLAVLKESYQQRSYNIREMCSLFVANYYERTSYNPTKATEATGYSMSRKHLAEARAARRNNR